MKYIYYLVLVIFVLGSCKEVNKADVKPEQSNQFKAAIGNITDFRQISFPSKDGLQITADLYLIKDSKNYILLCHQAGFSRGEYIETAKRLNKLGYSCVAIDQRSGKVSNNVLNETAKLAKDNGVEVKSYLDVKPDIEAAIDYVYKMNASKPIIIVGSSYSASLSLLLSVNNDKIKAVAAFSPGEYLKGLNLADAIDLLMKPVFVTSAKKEIEAVERLVHNVKSPNKIQFKPQVDGIHGSRALWHKTIGNKKTWKAFTAFLTGLK